MYGIHASAVSVNRVKRSVELKLFESKQIRTFWDENEEDWFFSVIDVMAVLTDSKNPKSYWSTLKGRLVEEGNQTVTNCDRLKMPAADGKMRLTDVANIDYQI